MDEKIEEFEQEEVKKVKLPKLKMPKDLKAPNFKMPKNMKLPNGMHLHEHETGQEGSVLDRLIRLAIGLGVFLLGFLLYKVVKKTIWAGLPFLIIAYIILGYDVVIRAVSKIIHKEFLDENFLMSVATIAAFIVGEHPEAVMVMLLYQIGELLEDLALDRSERSISETLDIRPDVAYVKRGGTEAVAVRPADVMVGELIEVRPGERVPLDGIIENGNALVDTSALTGESVPFEMAKGDEILSGTVVTDAVLLIKVTKSFDESAASRIIDLVKTAAERKAPTEQFVTKFARLYTPIVCALALLFAIIPGAVTGNWSEWIYRACILLVISCPCAIVISIPLAYFCGLGSAARKGVVIKGSNYLETLTNLDTVVFDKTGTLTKGNFAVTQISAANDFTEAQLLTLAAYAECQSNHPVAKSIMNLYNADNGRPINKDNIKDYKEIPGHGVSVIAGKHLILAGNTKLMRAANISFTESAVLGTQVYVAADGEFVGYIVIADEVREDARDAVTALKNLGVAHTVMLTGDDARIAASVSKAVGIEKYFPELLPDEKLSKLEEVMVTASVAGSVAFVGDGINDAPVLARADVGVAMGGIGQDVAIEAADAVIMTDEPSRLADAVFVAGETRKIVYENLIFSLAIKLLLFILALVGVAGMWLAIFGDVGVMLLAVFNSLRLLKK